MQHVTFTFYMCIENSIIIDKLFSNRMRKTANRFHVQKQKTDFMFKNRKHFMFTIFWLIDHRLCKYGADMTRPFSHIEWLRTPKDNTYKPHTPTLRVLLYLLKLSKYIKYTAPVTYRNWPNRTFVHLLILLN